MLYLYIRDRKVRFSLQKDMMKFAPIVLFSWPRAARLTVAVVLFFSFNLSAQTIDDKQIPEEINSITVTSIEKPFTADKFWFSIDYGQKRPTAGMPPCTFKSEDGFYKPQRLTEVMNYLQPYGWELKATMKEAGTKTTYIFQR